jgi:crotonobetainyl-CoA:carnitine CoA-transferase CaiB-like acyl-CoA transferase
MDRLRGQVPCAPVNSVEEALREEQILAREMIIETETERFGAVRHVASPIKTSWADSVPTRPAPDLGGDTDAVLREYAGYSNEQIARLRDLGAV